VTYERSERDRADFLADREAVNAETIAAINHVVLGRVQSARTRQLRREILPPLIVAWCAVIAAIVILPFTTWDLPVLAVLPLLGAGTFNFITGWPIKRR
jgi:uncharacterized membrane protein YdbT with pleckstrin-like domain